MALRYYDFSVSIKLKWHVENGIATDIYPHFERVRNFINNGMPEIPCMKAYNGINPTKWYCLKWCIN